MTEKIEWADFAEKIADYTGLEKDDIHPEMNVYYDLVVIVSIVLIVVWRRV